MLEILKRNTMRTTMLSSRGRDSKRSWSKGVEWIRGTQRNRRRNEGTFLPWIHVRFFMQERSRGLLTQVRHLWNSGEQTLHFQKRKIQIGSGWDCRSLMQRSECLQHPAPTSSSLWAGGFPGIGVKGVWPTMKEGQPPFWGPSCCRFHRNTGHLRGQEWVIEMLTSLYG